ncbi:MAG: TolC family protein [Gemmatimonadaceae bacterium]
MTFETLRCALRFRTRSHTPLNERIAQLATLSCIAFLLLCDARVVYSQTHGAPASPLTLQMVFDSLRAHHPALRAAESRIRAAQGGARSARTFPNPTISYLVDQTPFPGSGPLPGLQRESMTTATFPLEPFLQRSAGVARANAEVREANAGASIVRQRFGMDAAVAYYRAAVAQVQLATTRDLIGWLDTLVAYNRTRVKEGATAEADLIRSELERDRVSADESIQDAELAQARSALSAFLSDAEATSEPATVVVADMPLTLTAALLAIGDDALPSITSPSSSQMIAMRPDVRAAQERVNTSTARISVERSMLIRQIGATFGTLQTNHLNSMIAGISIPLPIFDQNRGEVQRAIAERDAAVFELSAQQGAATAELRGAYEAARILTQRMSTLAIPGVTNFLSRADESRRISLGAYREGAIPLYQVIEAARAWSDARNTYYRTLFAQHQSILNLIVARGLDIFTNVPIAASSGGTSR